MKSRLLISALIALFVCTFVFCASAAETHNYIAKADGTYVCADGCADVGTPDAPVIIAASPAAVVDGIAKVTVSINATTPILTTHFIVDAPDGFELVAAEPILGSMENVNGEFSATLQEEVGVPFNVVLLSMSFMDATIDSDVVELTFEVADTVKSGAVVTVETVETYNLNAEFIETDSVSAEITVEKAMEEGTYKYGVSATLANEILLEYLVSVNSDVEFDECYLKVEHYAYGSDVPRVENVAAHKVNTGAQQNVYRFYAPGVAAKEMNDRIVVTFCTVVDGETYVAASTEKNIVDYYRSAYAAYGNQTAGQAPAFMNTLYALINYGAAAQEYFGYNTANLVNTVLPADKQVDFGEFAADASVKNEILDDCPDAAYTPIGLSAALEDRIRLIAYFEGTGYDVSELTFKGSYTDINGNVKTFEVGGDNIVLDNGAVKASVDAIAAKDIRQNVTGALYAGEKQVSASYVFSFETYATMAYVNGNAALKQICAATLAYGDAAKALFYKPAAK